MNSNFPETVFPGQLICPEYDTERQNDVDVVYRYICGHGTKLLDYKYNGMSIKAITATLLGDVSVEEVKEGTQDDESESNGEETEKDKEIDNDSNNEETPTDSKIDRIVKTVKVSVIQETKSSKKSLVDDNFANNLPKEGDIVLTRVTRISLQRANVEILAVENANVPVDSGVGSNGSGIVAAGGGSGAATFSVSQVSSDLGETFRGLIRSQDVRATERDRVKIMDCFKPGDIVRAQVLSLGDGTNYYLTTARNDLGVVFARAANGAGGLMYATDWQTMTVPSTGLTEKRKCAKPL